MDQQALLSSGPRTSRAAPDVSRIPVWGYNAPGLSRASSSQAIQMLDNFGDVLTRVRPWGHLRDEPLEAENHTVTTDDGQTLRIRRVRPDGETVGRPVFCVHGLGANHRAFHFPDRSMAEWLAGRGRDVWLAELRGHGASEADGWEWRLDDHVTEDVPALLDGVLRETGAEAVDWIGHSMGGLLLLCHGIFEPDPRVARGVAVGSALDYRTGETGFRQLLSVRPLLMQLGAIPYGMLVHLLAPAVGRGLDALAAFNVWPPNIEAGFARRLHAQCFGTIPSSLLESLATTFEEPGLRLQDGFRFLEHADRPDFPMLLVAGGRDRQVDPAAVAETSEMVGPNAGVAVFDDYGHFDLILGRDARRETWTTVAEFLET